MVKFWVIKPTLRSASANMGELRKFPDRDPFFSSEVLGRK
jgi:hypothetical protein